MGDGHQKHQPGLQSALLHMVDSQDYPKMKYALTTEKTNSVMESSLLPLRLSQK